MTNHQELYVANNYHVDILFNYYYYFLATFKGHCFGIILPPSVFES